MADWKRYAQILFVFIFLNDAFVLPPLSVPEDYQTYIPCEDRPRCSASNRITRCDVLIIGAGFAGTYMAYQLSNRSVCVIEKLEIVGGRIEDVPAPFLVEGETEPRVFGNCALRVNQNLPRVRCLGNKLGIELVLAPAETYVTITRGRSFTNSSQYTEPFFNVSLSNITAQWDYVLGFSLYNPRTNRNDTPADPDYLSRAAQAGEILRYCRQQFGSEGCDYIMATGHTVNHFMAGVDARSLIQLERDQLFWGHNLYPTGGMSQYALRMEREAVQKNGARFFKNETVRCISNHTFGEKSVFLVTTDKGRYQANFLVNTLPPKQFERIGGKLAIQLTAQPQYRFIKMAETVTIQVWWSERWWEPFQKNNISTFRGFTTEHCVNRFDIATTPYLREQNVTRMVYTDNQCLPFWKAAIERGQQEIEREIRSGYADIFPGLTLPSMLKIEASYQPNAWSYLYPFSPYDNNDIRAWAQDPLPGQSFCHAGEAFNLQLSGWTEAAVDSVNRCFARHFGMNLDLLSNPCNLQGDLQAVRLPNEIYPNSIMEKKFIFQQFI